MFREAHLLITIIVIHSSLPMLISHEVQGWWPQLEQVQHSTVVVNTFLLPDRKYQASRANSLLFVRHINENQLDFYRKCPTLSSA